MDLLFSSNSAPSDDVPKSVIQPGNVIKVLTPVTGGTTVTTADGATLQLPQKSVPQTIVVQRGGSGTIQLATPGSKDKNATATGSAPGYEPKLIPGKSAICKSCGTTSPDFNKCIRCKRPIPPDCKVVEDKSSKGGKAGSASSDKDNGSLRNVRILGKKRKVKESDEPECIALSSDEDNDEDDGEKSESGGNFTTFILNLAPQCTRADYSAPSVKICTPKQKEMVLRFDIFFVDFLTRSSSKPASR